MKYKHIMLLLYDVDGCARYVYFPIYYNITIQFIQ